MAQTPKGGNCSTRVPALIANPCRLAHPSEVPVTRRRGGKRALCYSTANGRPFARAPTVVRKEQGDDAAEDQGSDALAVGDVHQVQDYEGTVTEERAAEKKNAQGVWGEPCKSACERTMCPIVLCLSA